MEKSSIIKETEKVHKLGLMGPSMLEIGLTISHMVMENLHIPLEIFTKGNGKIVKQMDLGVMCDQMEMSIQDNGKMMNQKVLDNRY